MNVFHKEKNDDTNHVLAAHNGFWVLFDSVHKAAFIEQSPTGKPTSTAQKSYIIPCWNKRGKCLRLLAYWSQWQTPTHRKHRVIWYHCGSNALNMTYNPTRGKGNLRAKKCAFFIVTLECQVCEFKYHYICQFKHNTASASLRPALISGVYSTNS